MNCFCGNNKLASQFRFVENYVWRYHSVGQKKVQEALSARNALEALFTTLYSDTREIQALFMSPESLSVCYKHVYFVLKSILYTQSYNSGGDLSSFEFLTRWRMIVLISCIEIDVYCSA